MYRISKQFEFCASHHLDGLAEGHPCSRVHGHNYIVEVVLCADELHEEKGWIVDFRELSNKLCAYIDKLDHADLNTHLPQPTSERLAKHLFEKADAHWPGFVEYVRVSETPKTWAEYVGEVG